MKPTLGLAIAYYKAGDLGNAKLCAHSFTELDLVLALKNDHSYTIERAMEVAKEIKK